MINLELLLFLKASAKGLLIDWSLNEYPMTVHYPIFELLRIPFLHSKSRISSEPLGLSQEYVFKRCGILPAAAVKVFQKTMIR